MTNPNSYTDPQIIRAGLVDTPDLPAEYDNNLQTLAERASRYLDGWLKRPAGSFAMELSGTETVKYYPGGRRVLYMRDEWLQISSVKVAATMGGTRDTWAANDDFYYQGHDATILAAPATELPAVALVVADNMAPPQGILNAWEVTGYQGYFVQANGRAHPILEQVTTALVLRWLSRNKSGWADAAGAAEINQPIQFRQAMDAELKELLLTLPRLVD